MIDTVKPHFAITLDQLNSKPCYFCGSFESYRDRDQTPGGKKTPGKKKESEPSEPGDFKQHEIINSKDLGFIAVFECSKCLNLLFFRSHYDEEGELFESIK